MKKMAWLFWSIIGGLTSILIVAVVLTAMPLREQRTTKFEYALPRRPNPLMGYAPWATEHPEEISVPFSLVYVDMTWREIEPEEGVFDFFAFEQRTHLDQWQLAGKRFVFRFLIDVPRKEDHTDIPDWLYEKINADGYRYDTSYGKGFSPNYANPILIAAHQKVIQAIADRYDAAMILPYIELGSLGHWGEWHIKSNEGLSPLPPASIRDQYIQHYLNVFDNSKFLTRRPFAASKMNDLGLFNDMFGSQRSTDEWLTWIQNGGVYDQTNEQNGLSPMPVAYLSAPIGGETTGSIAESELFGTGLHQLIQQVEDSHATFIGPGGYEDHDKDPLVHAGQLDLYDHLGYQFHVSMVEIPNKVWVGSAFNGTLTLINRGIAPFYFPWPLQFKVDQASSGQTLTLQYQTQIQNIQPGGELVIPFTIPIDGFEDGIVSIDLSILDPLTGQPGIHFANRVEDSTLSDTRILHLGNVEINRPLKKYADKLSETISKILR